MEVEKVIDFPLFEIWMMFYFILSARPIKSISFLADIKYPLASL